MFRFLTAGESHGRALTAIIEGVPAGLSLDIGIHIVYNREMIGASQSGASGGR